MKNVLIVDAPPIFQEFLKEKFTDEKIDVTLLQEKRDAVTKMASLLPELMIFDIKEMEAIDSVVEFLQAIKHDPNASQTPIIAVGPVIDASYLQTFVKLGVVNYFVKPIPFDSLFEAVGRTLKMTFPLDTTPCIVNIHRNDNIVVVEIAGGLNRDKLSLLHYKLTELIQNDELESPHVVLILSDSALTFIDGINVEFMLDNILSCPRIMSKNVKVITADPFAAELIAGHKKYENIETADNITNVLNSLVDSSATSSVLDLIMERILLENGGHMDGVLDLRFHSDASVIEEEKSSGGGKKVALVDNDSVMLDLLSKAFKNEGIACDKYTNGVEFLSGINRHAYDLIILDILISGISGFDILARLQKSHAAVPVIVHSRAVRREIVVKALSLGAKQYLVRPQKPEAVVSCAKAILGTDAAEPDGSGGNTEAAPAEA
ncbi:MAG: response regulator [Treponemataceae bacterium]|nr:response regulator [Treponemataceae bacterium]